MRGFRDGVEALKEFDEGDVFVRELQGDVRTVFSSHVDFFVRTRSRAIPPPARRQKQKEVTEIETHRTLQCRCCTKEGQRRTEFLSHKARVAHEVRALFLGGTHGLKLLTKITIYGVCPMCETVFPKLETARIHEVK